MDSTNIRVSKLRPPSQIPSPCKGLTEISASDGNARSNPPSMLPPPPTNLKHKLPQCIEPEPKQRKTFAMAEKAGEPYGKAIVPPTASVRPSVKGISLAGTNKAATGRNTSLASSTSSRVSASSRNTSHGSHGSFSNSVGQISRPLTTYKNRSQTSMAFNHPSNGRIQSTLPRSRPATSMDSHAEGEDGEEERRKGTTLLTSIPSSITSNQGYSTLQYKKPRDRSTINSLMASHSAASRRDVSISTAMTRLKLDGEVESYDLCEHQAISSTVKLPSTTMKTYKSSTSTSRNLRTNINENAVMLYHGAGDSLVAPNPKTPSQIPVLSKMEAPKNTPATPCRASKQSPQKLLFLTKDSNVPLFTAWDTESRLGNIEAMFCEFKEFHHTVKSTTFEKTSLEEALTAYKSRLTDLETYRAQLTSSNQALQSDIETMRQKADMLQQRLLAATANLDEQMRAHHSELDKIKRGHRDEIDDLGRRSRDEMEKIMRLHRDDLRECERRVTCELEEKLKEMERRNDIKLEEERIRRLREVQELEGKITSESQNLDLELQKKERELQNLRGELEDTKSELDREKALKMNAQKDVTLMKEDLKSANAQSLSTIQSLEATVASLRARIHFLESGSKAQSDSFAEMEARLQDAIRSAEVSKQKLIKEESLRRILFNQVQELKGNIRVMCRVRPIFANGDDSQPAKISFPDIDKESKELSVLGKEEKSSLGTVTRKNYSFTFDRVFGPETQNQEVFEEISQLVQSALDGYNVCIFCYGQTGSGKTHTMSSEDGMIPRATHQIYETATNLKEKGWEYTMEGSFVEVYNEEIHDLLGNANEKKKHEIRHDDSKKQTTITGLKTVTLDTPNTVETILKQAANNRSVAATKSNERSSRSHSVFILKLVGRNSTTNETSEGTLNLVDLAGSERLKQSGAEGDRMKETQNINKSLSCLGDVIGALGQGKEGGHIPYRNSKLTYLLQYSLGGNSKTLMFVMASPLEAHVTETLTSLRFATKVYNTHIGTAKKSVKSS